MTSGTPNEGTADVLVLEIDGAHRGRAGDDDLELVTFELLFEEAPGDPLTGSVLDALVDTLRIYHDDGDGVFETDGSDFNFHTVGSPFNLTTGILTTSFIDGEANVQVALGTDETYFVTLDLEASAGTATPHTLIVTHLTESSSTGEMTSTDLPLNLEYQVDQSSSVITVNGPPSVAASIGAQSWYVDSPLSFYIAESFSDPQGDALSYTATGLPATITLATNGLFSGTPMVSDMAASPFTIVVRGTDPGGFFVEDTFGVTVVAAPGLTLPVGTAQTVASSLDGADDVVFGDLDGDGDLDLIAATTQASDVTFWENAAGDGSSWSLTTIDGAFAGSESVAVGDVDGDGDLDVLASAMTDDLVAWFDNTAGDGSVWTKVDVAIAFDGPVDAELGDIDGDGDPDIVAGAADGDEVAWWSNTAGDGSVWSKTSVDAAFDASSVGCLDIDGDGDLDILGTSFAGNLVSWWENTSGDGSAWAEHPVTVAFTGLEDAIARDVDADGDVDVLFAASSSGSIGWSENVSGDGLTWIDHLIGDSLTSPEAIRAFDLDLDGDLDAIVADSSGYSVSWWENLDSAGSSWIERPVAAAAGSAAAVAVGDIDGDGDFDFVASDSSGDEIAWWENETLHRSAVFPTEYAIDGSFDGVWSVYAADMDGDGDLDVLGSAVIADDIAWWENSVGDGTAWTEHTVDESFNGARLVFAGDVDGDGDLDVLGAAFDADDIAWWENTSGDGTAWTKYTIDGSFDGATSVYASDVDGDGDLDVLGTAAIDGDIAWWENTAGDGTAWTEHTVDDSFNGSSVYAADVDGDGDTDVLGAAAGTDDINWWENTAGDGTAWIEHIVDGDFDSANSVHTADVDSDGDLDVLGSGQFEDAITWWENSAGDGTAWIEHTVDGAFDDAGLVYSADMDGDGDVDVLGVAANGADIAWWENTSGDGSAWTEHTVDGDFNGTWIYPADIDGNGLLDVLGADRFSGDIAWWENRGGQFALPTADAVASATPNEGTDDVLMLEIDGAHRGRSGDGNAELSTLELLFEETIGDSLLGAELDALADTMRLYLDDGDEVFEPGTDDDNFFSLGSPFTLNAGVLTLTMVDGDPDVQLAVAANLRWWLAADLTAGSGTAVPDTFRVTHLTESSSTGEMASTDLPLRLEFAVNTASTPMAINGAPTVLSPIGNQSAIEAVPVALDLSPNFGDPELDNLAFTAIGLPNSVGITSSGTLVGTPATSDLAGSPYTVTVTVTDGGGLFVQDAFELELLDNPDALFVDGFESGDTLGWSSTTP